MTRFYYSKLIENGLIGCELYKYVDDYIGFIVYTKYPFSFIHEGKNSHFLYLIYILMMSSLQKPGRMAVLSKMFMSSSGNLKNCLNGNGHTGQFLSFGVLEKYRNLEVKGTGMRLSHYLMERVFSYFQKENFQRFFLLVLKTNSPAIELYKSYGGIVEENPYDKNGYIVTFNLKS